MTFVSILAKMDTLFYDYKSIWETLNHQVLNHSFWLFSGLIASQRWKHSFTCNTCWRNSQQCLIKTFKACAFFASLQIPCKVPWKTFVAIMIWWLSLHYTNCFCHRFIKGLFKIWIVCFIWVFFTLWRINAPFLQQPQALSRRAPHVFCVFCFLFFSFLLF